MQPLPPPPRRATTLPTPGISSSNGVPNAAPGPTSVAVTAASSPAALAHHRSLVAYFWHYAQQGYAAPLTAPEQSDERRRQEAARTEAVEWARQCGIAVVDPGPPAAPPVGAVTPAAAPVGSLPAVTSGVNSSYMPAAYPTTSTTPYPLASPFPSAVQHVPSPGAVPPQSPRPPVSVSTTTVPNTAGATPRVPDGPVSGSAGRPLPAPGRTSTQLTNAPSSSTRARPLPRPPPLPPQATSSTGSAAAGTLTRRASDTEAAEVVNAVAGMHLQDDAPRRKITPKSPRAVASPGSTSTASPAPPSIPTFSFSIEDEQVGTSHTPRQAAPLSAPAVPTFSFGLVGDDAEEEDAEDARPAPSPPLSRYSQQAVPLPGPRRAAPLHPRFDPSHPSHRLYHPTSVMSPLSTPAQDHARPEAGTIVCSDCGQLIFGRVLFALGQSWHPDCFRCAEPGCGARLEVMEFAGTPEDWGGHADEAGDEGMRGKAWCMVHFEEVRRIPRRSLLVAEQTRLTAWSCSLETALRSRVPSLPHADRLG